MTKQEKIKLLEYGGCHIELDDKDEEIYHSVCIYDGRGTYGTLDELIDYYGL